MRAFLVLGPESTGTRLATRILVAGGCHGSDQHAQPFDREGFGDLDPVVWRRSVPHLERWLDLPALLERCKGRDVQAVVTVRDWTCTISSQIRNRHADDPVEAREHVARAYASIFGALERHGVPFVLSVYESLVLHPLRAQAALLDSLGLHMPDEFVQIDNGDAKHLEAA